MASLLLTHRLIQDLLAHEKIAREDLADVVDAVITLAREPSITLLGMIHELQQRSTTTQGPLPEATLELMLVAWSANYRYVSKRYLQLLLSQSVMSRAHALHNQGKRPLSQIIRCAQVVADEAWQGKELRTIFAKLSRYRNVAQGMDLLAEVLWYQEQFLEANTHHKLRPLPRKLLHAIRGWPYNDDLLPKVVQALEKQALLQQRIREQATELTEQHRLISVKQALLLLGPEASRELILITHFEAHLTHPYIPLRQELLHRRALLSQCLQLLCDHVAISLPCHADLLCYLWLYDCWYHPELSTQLRWNYQSSDRLPDTLAMWQPLKQKLLPQRALKLVDYWQLPATLIPLLRMHNSLTNRLLVCARLAHIATDLISNHGAALPETGSEQIYPLLNAVGMSWHDFHDIQLRAAYKLQAQCPVEPIPL